jgi:Protein of unknown function (DUF4058)
MPLHDWTDRPGWEGVHHLWITELLRWIKPRLPDGYRAYIGSVPTMAVGAPAERPDVGVRSWTMEEAPASGQTQPQAENAEEPDEEIAVAVLDPIKALYIEVRGRLVASVELISPRNKDRPLSRAAYLARYLGYLLEGVHLLLVDVHRRPIDFSFADRIAQELQIQQPPCPTPMAVSYRVGGPAATGGRILGIWRRPLAVGTPLPTMVLALNPEKQVLVDLEQTYNRAAEDAYVT